MFALTGSYKLVYQPDPALPAREIDWTPPFRRVSMMDGLAAATGISFPSDLSTREANAFLSSLCEQHDVNCPAPRTTARLLDKLVGRFLESGVVSPTFICDHPELLSPLAKTHRSRPGLTERFELFVCEREICNAYTELNNPLVQRERFAQQSRQAADGDDEAQLLDEDFCVALDYGLPPTAGWGMGIDRLAMLLSNVDNIKEVLLFPAMKPLDSAPRLQTAEAQTHRDQQQAAAGTDSH